MFEIFINNFIALSTMLFTSVIIVLIFTGILGLGITYIDYCFESIKNIYLRFFVLFIVSPLIVVFLVGLVLSIFGLSIVN